jgi:hypothetical protein
MQITHKLHNLGFVIHRSIVQILSVAFLGSLLMINLPVGFWSANQLLVSSSLRNRTWSSGRCIFYSWLSRSSGLLESVSGHGSRP